MRMMDLILLSLANYRLSKLITTESGPFEMFSKLRSYLGRQATIEDEYQPARQTIAELFNCPYCIGVWLAGILYVFRKPLKTFIVVFSISGIQSLLQSLDFKVNG